MQSQIRYCTTADGVRIAYAVEGAGYPVVIVPPWVSHLDIDDPRGGDRMLAVRYDKRGTGLSDRHLGDYSIETRLLDLEAVVQATELDRFAMVGSSEGGALAITYAAKHPELVRRLVLWGAFARGDATPEDRTTRKALVALIQAEWGMASAALRSIFFGDELDPAGSVWWNRIEREAVTADDAAAMWDANGRIDVGELLASITCPTLVVHGRNDRMVPFERARELAAGIRGARLFSDDGAHAGGGPRRGAAILQFLLEDEYFSQGTAAAVSMPQGTAVIVFTDIANSTSLTERLGDEAFRTTSRALDTKIRAAMHESGGNAVEGKLLGDGVLGVFSSAASAILAARGCLVAATDAELQLHIGLHAGDVTHEKDNVYGGAVNIASRICGLCEPGEILVSQTVRDLARTSAGVTFEDRGEHVLKGIADPVRVFAVRSGE